MQVSSPNDFHLRRMLENNINYIMELHLIASKAFELRWFFNGHRNKKIKPTQKPITPL